MFLGEDAIRPHSLDVILNLLSWFPSAAPLLLVQRILLGTFRKLLLLRCWRTASSAKDTILALLFRHNREKIWAADRNSDHIAILRNELGIRISLAFLYSSGLIPTRDSLICFSQYQCRYRFIALINCAQTEYPT